MHRQTSQQTAKRKYTSCSQLCHAQSEEEGEHYSCVDDGFTYIDICNRCLSDQELAEQMKPVQESQEMQLLSATQAELQS